MEPVIKSEPSGCKCLCLSLHHHKFVEPCLAAFSRVATNLFFSFREAKSVCWFVVLSFGGAGTSQASEEWRMAKVK